VYRYRAQAIGEIRRPLFVTRDVEVAITPEELLWPIDGGSDAHEPRHFMMSVTNRARGPANVRTAVTAPAGWPSVSSDSVAFAREDETRSVVVSLAAPATDSLKPGTYDVRAGGGTGWLELIDYPHIRPRALTKPSVAQIRAADWRGWIQERGLYFAHTWDTTYAPVLETHDPGPPSPSPELKGGLLIAPLGRGTYVYTGLSFFRQLPAGIPGPYRLFMNLLGLKRKNVP